MTEPTMREGAGRYGQGALKEGNVGNRGGRWMRRDVRQILVHEFREAIPKLVQMASGRVNILLGYPDVEQLARDFFEQEERMLHPQALKVQTWEQASPERRTMLIEIFSRITGGTLTQKEFAVSVGVADMRAAIDVMGKYGLGTQTVVTDEEGFAVPGVLVLPPLEMERVQAKQRARMLSSGDEIVVEDADLIYVEEDVHVADQEQKDVAPGPLVETVPPAVVEVIKRRRKTNGNGGGNGTG